MSVRIRVGDCLEQLSTLPEESVHCVVTSPPYWGLRDYGVEGAIGLERTLQEHIDALVRVFREVHRVLRKDGTLWLNYGDSYAGSWGAQSRGNPCVETSTLSGGQVHAAPKGTHTRSAKRTSLKPKDLMMMPARVALALQADGWWLRSEIVWHKPNPMPESVRDRPTSAHEKLFLLTKAARYFYDAEAVRVACSPNTHARRKDRERAPRKGSDTYDRRAGTWKEKRTVAEQAEIGANLRNVWTIATHPFPGAHFATFPPKLVEPCIKAGTSEKGCCPECGAPRVRVVEADLSQVPTQIVTRRAPVETERVALYLKERRERLGLSKRDVDTKLGTCTLYSWFEGRPAGFQAPTPTQWNKLKTILNLDDRFDEQIYGTVDVEVTEASTRRAVGVRTYQKAWNALRTTAGWQPTCEHDTEPAPCTVLDPFGGSGTVGLVADRLGRDAILIELNPEYAEIAERRIYSDAPLLADVGVSA